MTTSLCDRSFIIRTSKRPLKTLLITRLSAKAFKPVYQRPYSCWRPPTFFGPTTTWGRHGQRPKENKKHALIWRSHWILFFCSSLTSNFVYTNDEEVCTLINWQQLNSFKPWLSSLHSNRFVHSESLTFHDPLCWIEQVTSSKFCILAARLWDSIREAETIHWYCYRTSYFLKEVFRISFVLISIHFKTKHFRGSFEFHRIHSSTASDVKERRLSIDAYPICWCYWSCWYLLIQWRRNPLVVSAAAAHPPVFLLVLIRLVRPQGSATDWALCHAEADPLIQTNGRFLLLLASQQSVSSYQFQSCIIACLDSTGG